MKLADYLEILAYDAAFWLTAFRDPTYPPDQLGVVCIDACAKLRGAAIIVLLTKADSDAFLHNLMRSARCRSTYLRRLHDSGLSDHHQASGRVGPLIDATAAGDFSLAGEIADLSPTDWMQGHEYEDDFCYAQLLHELVRAQPDPARMAALLDRWNVVLAGTTDARLGVTRALAARDQADFDTAFEALIDARTAQIGADKARSQMEDPLVVAEREIYVEGLALLRLAGRVGLQTQREYRYCPSVAREPLKRPFPGE